MKAVLYEEYAPDDYTRILKVKEIADPRPNEVVFKVKAAAPNYNDIWGMRGQPVAVPLLNVSGSDAAGKVMAVGEDVTTVKVGYRVVSQFNMSCRVCKACTDGGEYDCQKRTIWGFQRGPTYRMGKGKIKSVIDSVWTFEQAAQARTKMPAGKGLFGKIIIKPEGA